MTRDKCKSFAKNCRFKMKFIFLQLKFMFFYDQMKKKINKKQIDKQFKWLTQIL